MKKLILLLVLTFMVAIKIKAQNGTKHISVRPGWAIKSAYMATISYDWNTQYFNQNEVFAEYYHDYIINIQTWMGGFVSKPILLRSKNTAIRYRFGCSLGTSQMTFIATPQIGFELSQSLGNGFDFMFINKNQYVLFGDIPERWRIGFEFGLRIPIN